MWRRVVAAHADRGIERHMVKMLGTNQGGAMVRLARVPDACRVIYGPTRIRNLEPSKDIIRFYWFSSENYCGKIGKQKSIDAISIN